MSYFQKRAHISSIRIIIFLIAVSIPPAVYLMRIFDMQVLNTYIYSARSRQAARRVFPIFAQRGRIFDKSYQTVLAENEQLFAITIVKNDIPNDAEFFQDLAAVLEMDPQTLKAEIEAIDSPYEPTEILQGVGLEKITRVAENIEKFSGIGWYNKPRRIYPYGEQFAHLIGYLGEIAPEELNVLRNQGYAASDVIGKNGIEQKYDLILKGENGQRGNIVDAIGKFVGFQGDIVPPVQGQDIVLSIDKELQILSFEALGDRAGSVFAMRPHTGEILAMVSRPAFDPNQLTQGDSEEFARLALDTRYPFLNRPLQVMAAPASTFKIIMNTAILAEKAFDPNQTIHCSGSFRYGDRIFHDWLEEGHGHMDLQSALAESCNVYYWHMGTSYLKTDDIVDYAQRMGLGELSGIDIEGEAAGLVPTPEWKEQFLNSRWVGGDTVNMSIGEGYLQVTPIQLALVVSSIITNGIIYKPHLLKEVRDPLTGSIVRKIEPRQIKETGIDPAVLGEVRHAMRAVIERGTAEVVITTDAVKVAGKTGTGQINSDVSWNSWFAAYAPYYETGEISDEQIVLIVMVEGSNEWEWWAPKAANIILHGYFTGMNFDEAIRDLKTGKRPIWYL